MIKPIAPFRNSDTRVWPKAPIPANVTQSWGLDESKVPKNAVAVALNVAAVPVGVAGWLAVFPDGQPFQDTSTVNFDGTGAHNGAIVVGVRDGKFSLRSNAPVHVIVDVTGYWT